MSHYDDLVAVVANHESFAVCRSSRFNVKSVCRENGHRRISFAHKLALDRASAFAVRARYDGRGQIRARLSEAVLFPTAGAAAS
jgi:hypothetical protein